MKNDRCNWPAGRWLAIAGASAASFAAYAADPASKADGVMSFPHVQVISAPVEASKANGAQATESQGGFKAFVDPTTRKLVRPTAEQAAALEAADAQRHRAPKARQLQTIYPAHGGVGVVLDESYMSYAVVRRGADGKLIEDCVPDESAALSFLKVSTDRSAKPAAKGELK